MGGADSAKASRSTSKPFHVSMRPAPPTRNASSGMPAAARKRPAFAGENSTGIGRLGDHHGVRAGELIGDRLRHADHLDCEATGEELFDAERRSRTARRSHARARRAGVRVIAAAAHPYQECSELVCTTSIDNVRMSWTIRATAMGQPHAVREPVGCRVGARDPRHRHDVHGRAGGFELGSQRRFGRHHHVALELRRWQAAQHPHQSLIRAAVLRDGLDRE